MKRFLLTTSVLIISWMSWSQILFLEDFDGISGPTAGGAGTYTFPSGWFLRNVDNRTPNAQVSYVNEAWERREDFNFSVIDSVMFSTSYYSPVGAADDWAWTPLIGPLPANTVLSWNAVTYDPAYPDGYEVRIMTSTQGPPTGGTGVIGNQITNSTVIFSTSAENATWTNRSVNLNAYTGESIYVAFRNNSVDKFLLLIDDVKVEVVVDYDAYISSIAPMSEYTQIPVDQAPSIPFEATVENVGLQSMTGLALNVDVYNSLSVNVYSASSTPITLNPSQTTTLSVPNFTPLSAGIYEVVYHLTANEVDQFEANDTIISSFTISDTVYARDNGVISGSIGIGAGVVGYIGQEFDITVEDTLTSITMGVTRGYVGRNYAVVIWDMVAGVPNQIIAASDTLVYPDDSADIYTLPIQGVVVLTPGQYAITAVEFDSTLAIGLTMNNYTLGRTWVNWPGNPLGGWANFEDFGANFARAAYLRANLGTICSDVFVTIDTTICFGESITVGSTTYTTSGNYTEYIPNTNICGDSVVMTTLTVVDEIITDISVSTDLTTITATTMTGANYQWIDCNTGLPIAGETGTTYTATVGGDYAVVISMNDCIDTSDCVFASDVLGINDLFKINGFVAFPNPSSESVHILSERGGNFVLINELGQVLLFTNVEANVEKTISVVQLKSGIYFLQDTETMQLIKLVVN